MRITRLALPILVVAVLAPTAGATPPDYSFFQPPLVLPASPGSASVITFQYGITGFPTLPRFAAPTQVSIISNTIVIDVTVEADPGGFLPVSEMQNVGPLPAGTYSWVIRVLDLDNFEIDIEESGEILVFDDPGASDVFTFVMDAREVESTNGDCQTLPCQGPIVASDAPATEFESFFGDVQQSTWNSILSSGIASGPDWATFTTLSFTDGFNTAGTGRSVFDIVFRLTQPLPYSITGEFEIDLPQVGNGITRFELREVLSGQSFQSIVGFTLEGPFEQMLVDESGTLQPGLYQLYALGVGCCDGADADWEFDATIGTPPPPPPVPAASGAGLALVAVALGAVGVAGRLRNSGA